MFPPDSKILVVDDSNFSRNLVTTGLKDLKFWKILEAQSAIQAQNVLAQAFKAKEPIQLMICDIHMPEMTGIELLSWVREKGEFKNLPVIIITSSQEKAEVIRAAKLGVSHFMVKPFDVLTMKDRILTAWEKHGQFYLKTAT